jgi:hypothetical protein
MSFRMVIFLPLMVSSVHETSREIHAVRGRPESPVCFPHAAATCMSRANSATQDNNPRPKHVLAAAGNYFNLKMIGFGESTRARAAGAFKCV